MITVFTLCVWHMLNVKTPFVSCYPNLKKIKLFNRRLYHVMLNRQMGQRNIFEKFFFLLVNLQTIKS